MRLLHKGVILPWCAKAMAMEAPFEVTEKTTRAAEEGAEVEDIPQRLLSDPLPRLQMGKQMCWLVCRIATNRPTQEAFDLLWPRLAKDTRRLSVRCAGNTLP